MGLGDVNESVVSGCSPSPLSFWRNWLHWFSHILCLWCDLQAAQRRKLFPKERCPTLAEPPPSVNNRTDVVTAGFFWMFETSAVWTLTQRFVVIFKSVK